MQDTMINADVDFDASGRQIGALHLSYSDDHYSYGTIAVPVAVMANGKGPTVLLTAGNHGDEYEGQVVLRRFVHAIDPQSIQGRLIILPALNYPAVLNESRVSPLDNGNMNRAYPADPRTPTGAIAHYLDTTLLPLCDAGIDFHSGGKSCNFVQSTLLCTHPDQKLMEKMLAMVEAFGAPYTMLFDGAAMPSSLDIHAQNTHGVPYISTETGGHGFADPDCVRMVTGGLHRTLEYLGVMEADRNFRKPGTTRFMDLGGLDNYIQAPASGLFEGYHTPGSEVQSGEQAGCIYAIDELERPATVVECTRPGTVVSCRVTGTIERGMFACSIAQEVSRDSVFQAGTLDSDVGVES